MSWPDGMEAAREKSLLMQLEWGIPFFDSHDIKRNVHALLAERRRLIHSSFLALCNGLYGFFRCGLALIYARLSVRVWSTQSTTCGRGLKWIISIVPKIRKCLHPPALPPLLVTSAENKWSLMAFFEFLVRGAAVSVFHGSEWCGPGSLEFLALRSEALIYQDVLAVRCVHGRGNLR